MAGLPRGGTHAEAMRILAGADLAGEGPTAQDPELSGGVASLWPAETMRAPEA